jgi:hypothetical protein
MYETVVRIRGQLAELLAALDPDAISEPAAGDLWSEFDRIERLGSAGKTLLARRIAATHNRDRIGTRTAAESLARSAGTSTAAAKQALETSTRITDLPAVANALRRGELSPAQASAISGAADADPTAQHRLLDLASRVSLGGLREECARITAAADPDPDATNRRIHEQRRCRQYTDAEGAWNLSARGTPQDGAAFTTVLAAVTDQIFTHARRDGRHESVEAYAFDALIALAQHTTGTGQPTLLANGAATPPGGEPADTQDGESVARTASGDPVIFATPAASRCPRCPPAAGRILVIWRCCGSTSRRCATAGSKARNCAKSRVSAPSRSRWLASYSATPSSNSSLPTALTWPTSPTSAADRPPHRRSL